MSTPATRAEFKKWCLRKLGAPTIEINLTDEQIDDRVDEALELFTKFHCDGSVKVYYKKLLDATDITNKYITLPDAAIGVANIFPLGDTYSVNNLFNIRYQLILNDLYDLNNIELVSYYTAMMHVSQIEEILVGMQPIRFNQYEKKVYIDTDWSLVNTSTYLVMEIYQAIDPEDTPAVWSDPWLQRYTVALIKENWGSLLTKYQNTPTVGGLVLNWDKIYNDAVEEIKELKDELIHTWSLPVSMFIG